MRGVKGFKDILPKETYQWRKLERVLTQVLDGYGFSQIRTPVVEETALFARSIGDATDIVEKEMYSFFDKSTPPTNLALRPEGTAGVVRAVIEHNMLRGDAPKLWYIGAMFRYEQPQKGRQRQFHQLGVESFGSALPDADAEVIALTHLIWQRLGIENELQLQINTIGESDERKKYRDALVAYLTDRLDMLDEDSKRRLTTNPLRILDSKDEKVQSVLQNAPQLYDFLKEESIAHFNQLKCYLDALGIKYVINPHLVRGLDYYNKTVFEWVTDKLGAQSTVCGGGRYDGLIAQIKGGEKSEPAVGFGLGLERLLLLIEAVNPFKEEADCDVFVVAHPELYINGLSYAQELRINQPQLRVKMSSATSLKSQMKKADKSGATITVIIAHDEVEKNSISIRVMGTGEQSIYDKDWLFDTQHCQSMGLLNT